MILDHTHGHIRKAILVFHPGIDAYRGFSPEEAYCVPL